MAENIIEIIRTFAQPAVATGSLSQTDLNEALAELKKSSQKQLTRDRLITYKEAAEQLGVSTRTIARMIECDELAMKRVRASCIKSARVFQSSVDRILTPPQS
jgi:excisionase family DNA binding protein